MARSESYTATHVNDIQASESEEEETVALSCQAQAAVYAPPGRHPGPPDPDGAGPSGHLPSYVAAIQLTASTPASSSHEPASDSSEQAGGSSAQDSIPTAADASASAVLSILKFHRDMHQENQDILLPTRPATLDNLSKVMSELVQPSPEKPDDYTCFIPVLAASQEGQQEGADNLLVIASHTVGKTKHHVQSVVVTPEWVPAKPCQSQMEAAFDQSYPDDFLAFDHHALTLKAAFPEKEQLAVIAEFFIQERGALMDPSPPTGLRKWIEKPWAHLKAECRQDVKDKLKYDDAGSTKQRHQAMISNPEGYREAMARQRQSQAEALLRQDAAAFRGDTRSGEANRKQLLKLEQDGQYAAIHPDATSSAAYRMGTSETENQAYLEKIAQLRATQWQEADKLSEERQVERTQEEAVALIQAAAEESPHLFQLMIPVILEQVHRSRELDKHKSKIAEGERLQHQAQVQRLPKRSSYTAPAVSRPVLSAVAADTIIQKADRSAVHTAVAPLVSDLGVPNSQLFFQPPSIDDELKHRVFELKLPDVPNTPEVSRSSRACSRIAEAERTDGSFRRL